MRIKRTAFREGVDTLVGPNAVFTGNIEAEGTIRVDGKVKGDIRVTGDVFVGDQAKVIGRVEASNIHLAGTVEGNISARGILRILSTAKLFGDIQVNSFVADEGAYFQGKCDMTEDNPVDGPETKKGAKRNYRKSSIIEDIYENQEKQQEKQ